jgi:N-acetylglutamate synthase-like GNAT family acetyltransferase
MPMGSETTSVNLVRELIVECNDPVLIRNFEYPDLMIHPFDLLQSFPTFQSYYQRLVVRGIRKAEVSRVIVSEPYRHLGIGELLVDTLAVLARSHQIQRLFLACAEMNAPLYRRSRFVVLPGMCTDTFANVNAPAIAMERELPLRH